MTFVAALPMYDFPWTADAQDALWRALADRLGHAGIAAPAALTRDRAPEDVWRDPALLFGQTCGYPYVKGLVERVALIATPCFGFQGCEGAKHRSFIVALAEGRADVAAIDCVSFALLARGRPDLTDSVAIVGRSELTPGLPYVASAELPLATIEAVRSALSATFDDPNLAAARATLGLTGALTLQHTDYAPVEEFESEAIRLGYPILA
jgi:ABC-type phosphate/phosphonate transport system substrate-binding protein